MHDVGKLAIPDNILKKAAALTPGENASCAPTPSGDGLSTRF